MKAPGKLTSKPRFPLALGASLRPRPTRHFDAKTLELVAVGGIRGAR